MIIMIIMQSKAGSDEGHHRHSVLPDSHRGSEMLPEAVVGVEPTVRGGH